MHGDADERVNIADSIELSEELARLQKPHEFLIYEGDDHGLTRHRDEWIDETRKWFNSHLYIG